MFKKIIFVLAVIILGGISGIIADRYFFPYLSTTKLFEKYKLLKKSKEDVTIIQKTEQVFMKEESSINSIVSQTASAVVSISYVEKNQLFPKYLTGQIVTSDGIIITYDPTFKAENKSNYKITTSDNNIFDADLWDFDPYSNVLFLKITASNLQVISLGNSDQIGAGEKVISISNAQGEYQNGYDLGILSRYGSSFNLSGGNLSSSEKLEGVFQIDFIQSESFAGGPIIDLAGETIGIIGIVERDGKKQFFAIPAHRLKNIIDRGIKKEFKNNPVLGIYYVPVFKSFSKSQGLKVDKGALVYSSSGQQGLAIIANSPAAKAGIRINDIIQKINGEEINSKNSLSDLLYKYKKGDQVELNVLRDGNEIKSLVQL